MSGFNLTARTASEALPVLADQIMRNGTLVESRAGNTKELLYPHITLLEPWRREILTPKRRASVTAQIMETVWVLSGRNDIAFIQPYLKRAADFSDDGRVWRAGYGPRLRNWQGVDQIRETIDLLTQDNGTRRAVMSLWSPEDDYAPSKDIPCNNWLHFLVRDGKLHLHVAIRSNDLIWGWSGINAFEWSALQEIVASIVGVEVGTLEFSISSLHIYERHFQRAEQLASMQFQDDVEASPRTAIKSLEELDENLKIFSDFAEEMQQGRYLAMPMDKTPLDPMFKSWIKVIQAHWRGTENGQLDDIRLWSAWAIGIRQKAQPAKQVDRVLFVKVADMASQLHASKHAVYGDSWKKRGEQVSIQANIARKIDRLGKAGAGDDNLDTSVDLLCYLTKYALWLEGARTDGPEHAHMVQDELKRLATRLGPVTGLKVEDLERDLTDAFEALLEANSASSRQRLDTVYAMRRFAFWLTVLRYQELQENHVILRRQRAEDDGPDYEADAS
jgi:thymidylate synthase